MNKFKKPKQTATLTIRIYQETYDDLKNVAKENNTSISNIVKWLIGENFKELTK